jgi:DNA-binding CsgD family transcriptional regulator
MRIDSPLNELVPTTVVTPLGLAGRPRPPTERTQELIARGSEQAAIERALDLARRDRGTTIVVEAADGIGKTSLLRRARAAGRERGFSVLAASGRELQRDLPFGLVRRLVRRQVSQHDAAARWGLGSAWSPLEDRLDPSTGAGPESQFGIYAILQELHREFVDLAGRRPLLIVIDDAHWGDLPSLQFVGLLSRRAVELPLVVVLATAEQERWRITDQFAQMGAAPEACLRLGPLSAGATRELVRAGAWADASEEVCAACHAATRGNPSFLVALLDELVRGQSGLTPPTVEEIDRATPDNVLRTAMARIARVSGEAVALARAVAVLGDESEMRDAAALASIKERDAREAADALTRADIFRSGGLLAFVHPIVRSAIYSDLSPETGSQMHARAARLLAAGHAAPDRIAAQLLRSPPTGERWALESLRQAAQGAIRQGRTETAAVYLRRALAGTLDAEVRADLLRSLGAAEARTALLVSINRFYEALSLLRSRGGNLKRRIEIAQLLSSSLLISGRGRKALKVLEDAIVELGDADAALRVELEADLAATAELYPDSTRSTEGRLRRLGGEHGPSIEMSAQRRLFAVLSSRRMNSSGSADEAVELAVRALADRQLLADATGPVPLYLAGTVLDLAGHPRDAEQLFSEVIEQASMDGLQVAYSLGSIGRARARFHFGALEKASADARRALDASPCSGVGEELSLAWRIQIAIEQRDLDVCDQELAQRGLDGVLPDTATANQLLLARGCLRLAQGRPRDALADLTDAGQRAKAWGRPIRLEWTNPAAIAHFRIGDRERASVLARESLELATEWKAPRQLGAALATVGQIEGGARGVAHLQRAVDVLRASDAHLEHARALLTLGRLLCSTERPGEGCRVLHSGRELASACGAIALVEAGDAELTAAGVRTDIQCPGGRSETLTARERRVAEMASNGLSNPDIAQRLFLSRKTVEAHLGNSYRKLGIGGRRQLAVALEPTAGG